MWDTISCIIVWCLTRKGEKRKFCQRTFIAYVVVKTFAWINISCFQSSLFLLSFVSDSDVCKTKETSVN